MEIRAATIPRGEEEEVTLSCPSIVIRTSVIVLLFVFSTNPVRRSRCCRSLLSVTKLFRLDLFRDQLFRSDHVTRK